MGILGRLFRARPSAAAEKILRAMAIFTEVALFMVHPDDYEGDDTLRKRVLVFLFGAIDALIQRHRITGQEMFDTLTAYLSRTFPRMTASDIEKTVSFLADASAHPAWVRIMQGGGQAMVDWSRGDSSGPSRLFKVVHHGTEDCDSTDQASRSETGLASPAGTTRSPARGGQDETCTIHDIGRAIVVATRNSRDAAKRKNIISPTAEKAFL
jgi:hypothetical protein